AEIVSPTFVASACPIPWRPGPDFPPRRVFGHVAFVGKRFSGGRPLFHTGCPAERPWKLPASFCRVVPVKGRRTSTARSFFAAFAGRPGPGHSSIVRPNPCPILPIVAEVAASLWPC